MKEFTPPASYGWNAWFWVDKTEFDGRQKAGQCKYRVEKAVGRANDGKLFLMVWTTLDRFDPHKFTQVFYEICLEEYAVLLDKAIAQGEVPKNERTRLLQRAKAPFIPPWDRQKDAVVYQNARYTLGQRSGSPYLTANGQTYTLSCHPYEPCLYITDENGGQTVVHYAFDPFDLLEAFDSGKTVASITGREYTAEDFCRIVEYAAGMGNINISDAETILGSRKSEACRPQSETPPRAWKDLPPAAADSILHDARVEAVLAEYADSVLDICLVKGGLAARGQDAHRDALEAACRHLFTDGDETVWHGDPDLARGAPVKPATLFAKPNEQRGVNFRGAFLYPPHGGFYTDGDFDRLTAALFPCGTDALDVYAWTTDWSDYFDDGHAWWGALCYTVYDAHIDRFTIILASATD